MVQQNIGNNCVICLFVGCMMVKWKKSLSWNPKMNYYFIELAWKFDFNLKNGYKESYNKKLIENIA